MTTKQTTDQAQEHELFLAKLRPGDAIVADLKSKYGDTQALGKDEKALGLAIKAVSKARTDIEKTRVEIVGQIVKVQKGVNTEANRLKDEIQAIELPLLAERKRIADEKQAEEERVKAAELALFNERTAALFEAGYTYDGANYVVGVALVPAAEILTMDQAALDAHLENGRTQKAHMEKALEAFRNIPTNGAGVFVHVREMVEADEQDQVQDAEPVPLTSPAEHDLPFGDPLDPTPAVKNDPFQLDHDLVRIYGDESAPEGYRPQGYSMGFEACRAMVLLLLADDAPPMKRSDLRGKIKALVM